MQKVQVTDCAIAEKLQTLSWDTTLCVRVGVWLWWCVIEGKLQVFEVGVCHFFFFTIKWAISLLKLFSVEATKHIAWGTWNYCRGLESPWKH